MADVYLDCTGIKCPMPIVKISKAMQDLLPGETLEVEATDPAFSPDLTAWLKKMGHELVTLSEGEVSRAVIKKC